MQYGPKIILPVSQCHTMYMPENMAKIWSTDNLEAASYDDYVLRGLHCHAADNVPNLAQVFDVYKTLLQQPGFLSQNGIPNATVAAEFINEVCVHSAKPLEVSINAMLGSERDTKRALDVMGAEHEKISHMPQRTQDRG